MATDPKIRYDIAAHAEGGGEVERLAVSLEKLDHAIDPAAAERAQRLTAELRELGQQQAVIARFNELNAAASKARSELTAAETAVAGFRAELAAGGTVTTAQTGRLEKLEAAVRNAKTEVQAQTAAFDASKGRLAALGIDSQAAAQAEATLAAATKATRAELQGLGTSLQGVSARGLVDELRQLGQQQQGIAQLRDLGAATDKASAALASAEKSAEAYRAKLAGIEQPTAAQVNTQQRLGFAVEDARAKLAAQSQVLADARSRLDAAGVETGNLAAAEERLRTAAQGTLAQVRELALQKQVLGREAQKAAQAETEAARAFADAERLLASSRLDAAGAARIVEIEQQIDQARKRTAVDTAALTAATKALGEARSAGDSSRVATQEAAIADAQARTEASTRRLTAAQAAFVAEVSETIAAEARLAAGEAQRGQQIAATAAAIDASRARTSDQTAAENALRESRARSVAVTAELADAQRRLDTALVDRRPVVDEERQLEAVRTRLTSATREESQAEERLAATLRAGVQAQAQQVELARQREQVSGALATRTTSEIAAEERLSAAQRSGAAAASELAAVSARLDTARAKGDQAEIARQELALAAARDRASGATREIAAAQERYVATLRASVAGQAGAVDATERLSAAQRLLDASLDLEKMRREIALEAEVAAARKNAETQARQLAAAQKLLDVPPANQQRTADAERAVAAAREQSEQAARRLAAVQALLASSLDTAGTSRATQAERDLTAAREQDAQAARALAAVEQALQRDIGTAGAAQAELDVAAARARSEAATRRLAEAQAVLVGGIRSTIDAETGLATAESRRAAQIAATNTAADASLARLRQQVAAEDALSQARARDEAAVRALADAQRQLDIGGDRAAVVQGEQRLAAARAESVAAARALRAAEQALAEQLRAGIDAERQQAAAERDRSQAAAASRASILEVSAAEERLTAAHRAEEAATRSLADADRALAQARTAGDQQAVVAQEAAVVAARRRSEAATRELADATRALGAVRASTDTASEATAEQRLIDAHVRSAAATREVATAERALDAARASGDQSRIAAQEAALATARANLQAATRDVAAGERTLAEARAGDAQETRTLSGAEQALAAARAGGDQAGAAQDELSLAAARQRGEGATRALADADRLLATARAGADTAQETAAEQRLTTAHGENAAAARAVVAAQRELTAARAAGDTSRIASGEAALAAAEAKAAATARDLTSAETGLVAAIRAGAAAKASGAEATRQLAAQEQLLTFDTQRAAAAADRMAAAWQTLGVRSFRDVQIEANKVRIALQQIQQTSRNPVDIKLATEAAQGKLRALNTELLGLQEVAQTSTAGAGAGFAGLATKIASAVGGVEALKKVVEVGLERQKLTAQLTSIFEEGSRVAGALGFVGQTAQDLGLRLDVAGGSFAKIAASAKGTSLEGQKTRDIFTAVAQASAALKLSNEETSGTLLAISQIMSKGTVSAEELRGQLGERLPGAFQIAARSIGVTTAELGELLKTGTLASDEFLPKFAAELTKTFGPGAQQAAKGLDAEFNRLINTLSTFALEIANSGLFEAVTKQVHDLADALRKGLDSGELERLAQKIGASLSSLVTFLGSAAEWALKFGDALLFVVKVLAEAALLGGIGKLVAGLGGIKIASAGAAAGMTAVGVASAGSAAGMGAAGVAATANAAKVGLLGSALRLLPAGIAIALVVEGLVPAGRSIGEFAARLTGVDRDLAAAHQRRIDELGGEIAALAEGQAAQSKYASLTLLGRKQLLEQSAETRAAYVQDVEGALAAAEAAQKYAQRLAERATQEKERARLLGASTEALATYGKQEREYAAEAQKAADRQAELRKELIAVQAAAKDLATGLSPAAIQLKEVFDGIVKGSKTAAEAVKEIAKAGDLTSVQGIQAFGQALRKLGEEGKLTPQQIEAAWKDAIDKLTGEDLQKFTTQARAAFGDSARDGAAAADAIRAGVGQAFKGLGLDVEQFATGVGKATRDAVADLDLVAGAAEAVGVKGAKAGDALRQGLEKGIAGAKTIEELALLGDRVDAFAAKGQLAAGRAAELRDAIDTARLGMGPLGEAAKKAGVDIGELTTGIGKGFKSSVADIDALATQIDKAGISAERASPLLADALDKRIAAAKTKQEIELLRAETEKLGASGKLMGTDYTGALDKINRKADELSPVLRQAQADAKRLGVELKDNVQKGAEAGVEGAIRAYERLKEGGKASADEVQRSFVNMANEVIRANGGIVPEWLKIEAETRNATIEVDKFGVATVKACADGVAGLRQLAGVIDNVATRTRNARLDAENLAEAYKHAADNAALSAIATANANSVPTQLGNKQASGTLGAADVADAQRNFEAASANLSQAQANLTSISADGYRSLLAEYNRARAILDAASSAGQVAPTGTAAAPGAAGVSPFGSYAASPPGVSPTFARTPSAPAPAPAAPAPAPTAGPTVTPSSTHTVNLTLNGGRTTTVQVASTNDAAAIEQFMQQLASAARSSGYTT